MGICPKCKAKLKCKATENIFKIKPNKLKCNICNTEIKTTKKTNKINSIIALLPLFSLLFLQDDIINFTTCFTKNNTISKRILICIIAIWGIIIYNGNFPWTEFEEIIDN